MCPHATGSHTSCVNPPSPRPSTNIWFLHNISMQVQPLQHFYTQLQAKVSHQAVTFQSLLTFCQVCYSPAVCDFTC